MSAIIFWHFPNQYFSVLLCGFLGVLSPQVLLLVVLIVFHVFLLIHSAFLLCSFCSHYLFQNSFASKSTGPLFLFMHSLLTCGSKFILLIFEYLVLFLFLHTVSVPLNLPSFINISIFISSNRIVRIDCFFVRGFFSFQYISLCFCFLNTSDCCRCF